MGDVIDFSQVAAHKKRGQGSGEAPTYGEELHRTVELPFGNGEVRLDVEADGRVHMAVTVHAAHVPAALQDARRALARSLNVDSRDEAQMKRLRDQLGEEGYEAFFPGYLQQQFLAQACEVTGVEPYLLPAAAPAQMPAEGEDFAFEADMLLRPKVELSSYDPVEIEFPEKREITTKDVSDYLAAMADQLATYEPDLTRDTVAESDHVIVSIEIARSGDEANAVSQQHMHYVIGTGMLPDEFDRNLVGMKVRQTRDFSVSMPTADPQTGEVAYEVMKIKATVEEIERKVPARIDDAWVIKNAPEAGTLLGLRAKVRESLEAQAQDAWHDQMMLLTSAELTRRLEGKVSSAYVERMRDELFTSFALDMQRQGVDVRSYMAQPDFDAEAFEKQMSDRAAETLRHDLALDALADHLQIEVSDADINAMVAQIAPGREGETLRNMRESGEIERMRELGRRSRASDWLVETAIDSSGPRLQLV